MPQLLNNTYEISGFIGSGGMSTVFKARHIRLGIDVAVKAVRKSRTVNLLAEVNILTKLNHPNLVRVIDIFEDDRLLYIVMDYIEGENLQSVIDRVKVIPEFQLTEWFKTMADTLCYLHTRRPPIIYRDMKPSNIILQKDGSLKLIDFGIAREYKAAASSDTAYIGTNGFAAPEQFGRAQTDERTDIYSLGMTMYYLATGKRPLSAPYGYIPARQINPALSEKTERILEKCIRDNPEDRYQNAGELLLDLNDGVMPAGFGYHTAGGLNTGTGTEGFRTGGMNHSVPQVKRSASDKWMVRIAAAVFVFALMLAEYFILRMYINPAAGIDLTETVSIVSFHTMQSGIEVKWSVYPGADEYRVYRQSGSSGIELIRETSENIYIDPDADQDNQRYTYSISAVINGQETEKCEEKTAIFLACSEEIEVSRPNSRSLRVSWYANDNADGYQIQITKGSDITLINAKDSALTESYNNGRKQQYMILDTAGMKGTYKIEVRCYKLLRKTHYSGWSEGKEITIEE